ncbi:MAG: hypothetical protein PVI26_00325 [Chitinispirillia bacterium]|jgi:hypothetical protein
MKKNFFFVFFLSFLPLINCTINGKITDISRETIVVNSLYLAKPNRLMVYNGNTLIKLNLNRVKIIRIQPDEFKVLNKTLFCLTEITFRDGTTLGSFNNEDSKMYLASNQYLYGKIQNGSYQTMLNNVLKIELID